MVPSVDTPDGHWRRLGYGSDEFGSYIAQLRKRRAMGLMQEAVRGRDRPSADLPPHLSSSTTAYGRGAKGLAGAASVLRGKKGGSYGRNLARRWNVRSPYGFVDGELMTFVVQRRGDDYTISVTTSAVGEKVVLTHTKAGTSWTRPAPVGCTISYGTVVEEETALTTHSDAEGARWCCGDDLQLDGIQARSQICRAIWRGRVGCGAGRNLVPSVLRILILQARHRVGRRGVEDG